MINFIFQLFLLLTTGTVSGTDISQAPLSGQIVLETEIGGEENTSAVQTSPSDEQGGQYAKIAQCLTSKGVKFYGAFWCPHCVDQKEKFGEDIKYITYIECDERGENPNPIACQNANIKSYPTWVFPGDERLTGTQDVSVLAQKAACN